MSEADIAVVFMASLGDFICFCSVARLLRKQDKQLLLICRNGAGIEEFAEITGYYQKIVPLPHGYLKRLGNLRILRAITVDTVIIAPVERHALLDLYALAVNSRLCILPDTMQACSLPGFKRKTDALADRLVPVSAVNEQERYEEYLAELGIPQGTVMPFVFDKLSPSKDRENIVVFPGAGGGSFKQWPLERFAEVLKALQQDHPYGVSICGTVKEKDLGERLCRCIKNAENLCGETNLEKLISILERAALVICNDTGAAHLSVACGTPTVVICGGWEYGRFYPNNRMPISCLEVLPNRNTMTCIPCKMIQINNRNHRIARCVSINSATKVLIMCRKLLY